MAICGIIFDLDGVLVNSADAHRESWQRVGRERGVEISGASFEAVFGRQNRDIIPILFGDDVSAEEVRQLALRKEELYRELVCGHVSAVDGAVDLVHYYNEHGYLLSIGSSTPRANVDLAIAEMGLADIFEVIVSGDDVSIGKPDPAVFLTAARRMKLDAEQCMVIEDAPAGIQAARAAGMPVVALVGSHPIEDLRHANRVVRHLCELIPKDVVSAS